jgi:hypothetical protein
LKRRRCATGRRRFNSGPKHVLFFNHFDVWAYGTNYLQFEFLKATNGRNPPFGTPAAPCD